MNKKEALEIISIEKWQNKYSERQYYQAKGYLEAIEKAKAQKTNPICVWKGGEEEK